MRLPVRPLLVAGLVTVALVVVGLLTLGGDRDDPAPAQPAAFRTTPLSAYDTLSAVVARAAFCEGIDPRQVEAALDGEPASADAWQPGDALAVGGGDDLVHEYGCSYAGADGTLARAWVFAPPLEEQQAATIARTAAKAAGCVAADGPTFGDPTLAMTCTGSDGVARASYRGLFGDAWLVCEVTRPAGADWDAADRAGRWCVGVLGGLRRAGAAGASTD